MKVLEMPAPRKLDVAEARRLRLGGLSLAAIATRLGVSRNAVWKALRKADPPKPVAIEVFTDAVMITGEASPELIAYTVRAALKKQGYEVTASRAGRAM